MFLKSYENGRIAQRVAPVSVVMSSPFQAWLARENHAALNVYVSVNVIRPAEGLPTANAPSAPFVMCSSTPTMTGRRSWPPSRLARDLPPLSYVLHSSPNRVHVFWRVAGFTIEHVEALQKQLARELDTDPAATSVLADDPPARASSTRSGGPRAASRWSTAAWNAVYTPGDFPTPSAVTPRGISTTRACQSGTWRCARA